MFKAALVAVPSSVKLWYHYFIPCVQKYGVDNTFIREKFERAIEICGMHFQTDQIWELYIGWLEGKGDLIEIYRRLLRSPTKNSSLI